MRSDARGCKRLPFRGGCADKHADAAGAAPNKQGGRTRAASSVIAWVDLTKT